ncbi:MAG: hypothetical protein ACK56F_12645, partial [bacterium]
IGAIELEAAAEQRDGLIGVAAAQQDRGEVAEVCGASEPIGDQAAVELSGGLEVAGTNQLQGLTLALLRARLRGMCCSRVAAGRAATEPGRSASGHGLGCCERTLSV